MPDNGSGSYTLAEPPPENGQIGDATPIAANLTDIESALTARAPVDGSKAWAANQPMGGFKHTGIDDAAARTEYASAGQVGDSSLTYGGVAGGTADVLTIAPSPAIEATYKIGQKFQFKVSGSANTGAVTLNVNSRGAGAVTWPDGTALIAGDLPANAMVVVVVQAATPVFHLVTRSTTAPTGSVTNAMLANMIGPAFKARSSGTGAPQDVHARSVMALAAGGNNGIGGLTYANNGSDATNDIDIATGGAMDSTGAYWLALSSALTKRLDANWAVGSDQGGILSGSAANVDYNIWLIGDVTNSVVDVGFETTANATPTLPGTYTVYRKIGWFKRVGGTIVAFTTRELAGGGIELKWTTPTLEVDISTLSTSRRTDAAKVPLNFKTEALVRTLIANNTFTATVWIGDPAETDAAPSLVASPLATHYALTAGGDVEVRDQIITTSAAGLIAARSDQSSTIYRLLTYGFRWPRR